MNSMLEKKRHSYTKCIRLLRHDITLPACDLTLKRLSTLYTKGQYDDEGMVAGCVKTDTSSSVSQRSKSTSSEGKS